MRQYGAKGRRICFPRSAEEIVGDATEYIELNPNQTAGEGRIEELLARVRSLGRRQARQRTTLLQHGNLKMDLVAREVSVNSKAVYLTQREYALLEIFLQNVGRVLTRTQIAEKIWDCHFDMETNLIDVYVRRLRAKLGTEFNSPITTIRGVGYTMS